MKEIRWSFWAKWLVLVGAAYYVLWRVAPFTEGQARNLGGLVAEVILLSNAASKTPERFQPFRLFIQPQWPILLRDQGLVDDKKLESLRASVAGIDKSTYNLLRDGINLTVLGPDLYYADDLK